MICNVCVLAGANRKCSAIPHQYLLIELCDIPDKVTSQSEKPESLSYRYDPVVESDPQWTRKPLRALCITLLITFQTQIQHCPLGVRLHAQAVCPSNLAL